MVAALLGVVPWEKSVSGEAGSAEEGFESAVYGGGGEPIGGSENRQYA